MEPGIKSEPCETLYSGQESDNGARLQYSQHLTSQISLKRPNEGIADSADQRRTRNQTNTTYYPAVDFPNVPHQFYNQDNTMLEPNQSTMAADGRPLKKYKRIEENVLFNPPFFKLVEKFLSPSQKEAIGARCYSCGKIVKGNRGISSNFIKHMKRAHPEINKIYEDFKAHKIKPGHLPNLVHALEAQMLSRNFATAAENGASGSDSNAAYSNDDTNQFSEVNNTLENNTMCYSSDENEESLNTANEKSYKESQQQEVNNFENRPLELSSNTLEIFGKLIDEKLQHFVKQKEYNQLNDKVDELIKRNPTNNASSETALTELKTEMDNLKKECAVLRLAVQQSQASKRQLQNELQTVDKLLHQRKLIIRNIQVFDSEQPLKSVKKLFTEKLDLPDIKIINCSIIPSLKTSNDSNKECLSLELDSPQACKAIFRQAHKLKNTGIYIESEISPFQRKRKNKLMVLRKELLRRKPDLKVLVRDITLVVNGKNFYWDDVEGLCHDGKHEAIELNGVEYLNMLSGLDISEFISILQNYNIQIN
ncbi:uncharacterized protein LOC135957553 [Calliphora vicina]|uniref:uncharacterized protein LOC135957553 n=1 Tax=Calliphora vicina TaxID=7373 RepID=UPI00325B039A